MAALTEIQKHIQAHLAGPNPDGVSITDCFVGMVEAGEATIEDIRIAIGEEWAEDVEGELARFAEMEREPQE